MINQKLNDAAVHAVTAPGYETKPHFCLRWVREVCQHVYGSEYDEFWAASAKETGQNFLDDGTYVIPHTEGAQAGDILFKLHGSGGAGHVGIRVLGNRVAENSSVHFNDNGTDARGFRSLIEFGHYDVIVRLPNL